MQVHDYAPVAAAHAAATGASTDGAHWLAQPMRVADAWIDIAGAAILIVTDGRPRVLSREFMLLLEPGTVLVHDGREPLRVRAGTGHSAGLVRLQVQDASASVRGADPALRIAHAPLLPLLHDPDSDAASLLAGMFDPARTECDSWPPPGEIAPAIARFALAQREAATAIERCRGRSPERRRDQYVRLARARAIIAWSEGDTLDVARLAEIARLSPAHFVRLFHRVFDAPPHRYRIERRMQLAHRLIRDTRLPVGEIVRQLGLGSHSTFTRTFRRHFGVSATRLREQVAQSAPIALEPGVR